MMHGHEKSDSVIVAAKPANKAEQPVAEGSAGGSTAAESAEPRTETRHSSAQSRYIPFSEINEFVLLAEMNVS